MAKKSSSKDKHRKKHSKEKSKRRKREKSKKSKYESKSSGSSSSSSEDDWKNKTKEEPLERSEWDFLNTVLSDSCVTVKEKKEKSKRPSPERPGQNVRELNPYWKDGGCGLPPAKTEREASGLNSDRSTSSHRDYSSSSTRYDSQSESNSDSRKLNFLKPGENSNFDFSRSTFRGNWKKKGANESESDREKMPESSRNSKDEKLPSSSESAPKEDLNKIAAKLVKAEIMGNNALVIKLKAELEAAKRAKNEIPDSRNELKEKTKEVVVLTDRVLKKQSNSKQSPIPSKKQKVITHDSGERVCYFPDDDKYSLKNLFEKERAAPEEEVLLPLKLDGKSPEEVDDMYLEAAASNKVQKKMEEVRAQREIKQAVAKHKTLEGCQWCLDNRNTTKHLIVSTGTKCYLCLPEQESLTKGHCLIVPFQHEISMMHLDEDVWNEIKTYQRVLTQMFLESDQDVVFFENARSFKHFPHCYMQCVPLSKEMGDLAPIYFQKAISESDTEWSSNKKVIDFRKKDLRRSIPKGLPYFAVMFGTSGGFAHIIEDEYLFKRNFAEEVLGGMMDLDHKKWRKQQKDDFRTQREKAFEFLKNWKKFEFNENATDSESSTSD